MFNEQTATVVGNGQEFNSKRNVKNKTPKNIAASNLLWDNAQVWLKCLS